MPLRPSLVVASLAALVAVTAAAPRLASANPKHLPFSYGVATQRPGDLEVEQYVDMIYMRVGNELPDGSLESTVVPRYQLQTELELGITDRLEAGFYLVFRQGATAGTPFMRFQGIKQRLRYRFLDVGASPIGAAVYLEVAEFHDEVELEQKLLLEYRAGALRAMVNLVAEQEYYFVTEETKLIYNPSAGVSYEIRPWVALGGEYWVRGRLDDTSDDVTAGDAPTGAHHYLGPTAMFQGGDAWISVGAYVRLDGLGKATAIDDSFGRLWVRVIVGYGL